VPWAHLPWALAFLRIRQTPCKDVRTTSSTRVEHHTRCWCMLYTSRMVSTALAPRGVHALIHGWPRPHKGASPLQSSVLNLPVAIITCRHPSEQVGSAHALLHAPCRTLYSCRLTA
jgi:hypothetical protein